MNSNVLPHEIAASRSAARTRDANNCFRLNLRYAGSIDSIDSLMTPDRLSQSLNERDRSHFMRRSYRLRGYLKKASLRCLILAAGAASIASAQTSSIRMEVVPSTPGRLLIEASGPPSSTWSFPDSYGGALGLASRVEKFQLFDSQDREISVRKLAPGQFASDHPATKFKYEMQISPPARASDAALVSWLDSDRGVLMIGDLLPAFQPHRPDYRSRISVRLELPSGWVAHSTEAKNSSGEFDVADADRALIAIGRKLRASTRPILDKSFTFVTDEQWAFADYEALDLAVRVLRLHSEVAGALPCRSSELLLLPFSQNANPNKWSAQTRGCTVTLLMGKLPSKVAAQSQLGLALTHELFHLWIPNALALSGDYDWFYEGFTMYQAVRAAVRLDFLTFQQFLNSIADAYYGSAAADIQNLSLVEASKRRWTTGGSAVYSKAMVVAFLYDLNLRSQNKGKRSLDDVYRKIFRDHLKKSESSPADVDGNALLISALRSELPTPDFAGKFITSPAAIDLPQELSPFGLTVEQIGLRTHIFVSEHLTSRQRDLLRQLSYNQPRRR